MNQSRNLPRRRGSQETDLLYQSFDNWHVFGIQHTGRETSAPSSTFGVARTNSTRSSPKLAPRSSYKQQDTSSEATNELSLARSERERSFNPVIARISTHALRLEREYHLCRSFVLSADPNCNHTVRLIDLVRLPNHQGDGEALIVSIFESPGRNYLGDLLDFRPKWLLSNHDFSRRASTTKSTKINNPDEAVQISLTTFLDFAIGATECLELLHHGLNVVHGELRHDAFHFDPGTGAVKLINFGSGPRSFENGLTSTGWLTLSREVGIKKKLQFIAPEQTGRMPAEPDSRTDIYSLGVMFWTMLTQEPAFDGDNPIDIVQAVLGRRMPPVSSKRMDIPEVISGIIQKMTQKQIDERYHSTSGLKHDLVELQKILCDGDGEALKFFKIGLKDVSSFFVLPTHIFGRSEVHGRIVKVIEKVSRRQQSMLNPHGSDTFSTSNSGISEPHNNLENGTKSSDASSQAALDTGNTPFLNSVPSISEDAPTMQLDSREVPEGHGTAEKPTLETNDSRNSVETTISIDTNISIGSQNGGVRIGQHNLQHNSLSPMKRRQGSHRVGRRRRCELISIIGAAGLGKSSLIQSTQGDIRRLGYFASAKFDPARKAPFEPLLRALASLFRQIFSESDVNSHYHNTVRTNIRPSWPSLCSMLDLPENLVSPAAQYIPRTVTATVSSKQGYNKSLRAEIVESSSIHSGAMSNSLSVGPHLASDFLRAGSNPRSLKFMNIFLEVLRVLSNNKLICLCLDDLHFADEESSLLVRLYILTQLTFARY